MNFHIDNTEFNAELDLSDTINIQSSRKIYAVEYSKKNLAQLVEEIYIEDDFIYIDRNVYNLNPQVFEIGRKILIFDALESNKNIDSVLELVNKLYILNFTKKNKLIVIGGGIT
jgi:3-dehydroquinate synthetase